MKNQPLKWYLYREQSKIRHIVEDVLHWPYLNSGQEYSAICLTNNGFFPPGFPVAWWNGYDDTTIVFYHDADWRNVFNPLKNLEDAWRVVDACLANAQGTDEEIVASLLRRTRFNQEMANMIGWWTLPKEQLCERICLAALTACGSEVLMSEPQVYPPASEGGQSCPE